MQKAIHTSNAPEPIGPYAQARRAGDLVFCSGQIGLDPATGTFVAGGPASELAQALKNLEAVLGAAGLTRAAIVRVDLFVTDLAAWSALNEAYASFFAERPYPARVTIEVKGLPQKAAVEVSCVAVTSQ